MNIETNIRNVSFAILVSAIIFVFIVSGFYVFQFSVSHNFSEDPSRWAEFGDYFGGALNPILTFLSLIAILAALGVQTKELRDSTSALNEQSKHLKLQAFENTFFSLMEIHQKNIATLDLEDSEEVQVTGRRAFRYLYGRFKNSYELQKKNIAGNLSSDEHELVSSAYQVFFKKNQSFIGHYLRGIRQIIVFVDRGEEDCSDNYWSIVKEQLSDFELALVFYHVFCTVNFIDIEKIKKHGFFDNLPNEILLKPESHGAMLK